MEKTFLLIGGGGRTMEEIKPNGLELGQRVSYGDQANIRQVAVVIETTGGPQGQKCIFTEDYHESTVSITTIEGLGGWQMEEGRASASEIMELKRLSFEKDSERITTADKQRKQAELQKEKGRALLAEKQPAWAKAAIMACREIDDCDGMTDYFATKTAETVIIGWSKHNRDLFPEMRKAAAASGMEEIKHLGPGLDVFKPYVILSDSVQCNGSYYHKGQSSHWHHDLCGGIGEHKSFTTLQEAEDFIAKAGEAYPINFDGQPVNFEWKIEKESIEHREKYSMGAGYYLKRGSRYSTGWKVYKIPTAGYNRASLEMIAGSPDGYRVPETSKPKKPGNSGPTTPTNNGGGVNIEEHTHTKRGFQMFIVILPGRVERSEYLRLLAEAKDAGGWYSRKWGSAPAGFAFKEKEAAATFARSLTVDNEPETDSAPTTPKKQTAPDNSKDLKKAARFRTLADKLESQIENKFADRQTNTPKRLKQARSAALEGERLQRTQQALYALADLHEAGTVPEELKAIKSKADVYDLMGTKKTQVPNGYHSYYACTGEPYHDTPETISLWSLITGKTEEQKQAEEIQRKIDGLQFSKIPGYFPTPEAITAKMVEFAGIEDYQAILEPSAGSGNILQAIDATGYNHGRRVAIEYNCTLSDIGKAKFKEWKHYQGDFLQEMPEGCLNPGFDRIIMNPPFDMGIDIKHIKHAMQFLKPGGRIVALCANGSKQQKELMPLATHWEDLPSGSFKESGTMVNAALLVIDN